MKKSICFSKPRQCFSPESFFNFGVNIYMTGHDPKKSKTISKVCTLAAAMLLYCLTLWDYTLLFWGISFKGKLFCSGMTWCKLLTRHLMAPVLNTHCQRSRPPHHSTPNLEKGFWAHNQRQRLCVLNTHCHRSR